jgi:hypothetical protein
MSSNNARCECKTVEQLASDRKSPIEYDRHLNEYNLVSGDGNTRYRMYFCFFCGGKLPESRRAGFFSEPSDQEMKEVAQLLSKAGSMQKVVQFLGEPDETLKAPKGQNGDSVYKSHHRYLKRWNTLDLTIRERKDGSIDSAFTGKYRGESSRSAKKTRKLG